MRRTAPLPPPESVADPVLLRRLRIALIRGDYNREITHSLEEKCIEGLEEAGLDRDQIACYSVPGCFEIPILAQRLAAQKRYDILIALGAVIRGGTLHFELVAQECARGIMEVSLKYDIPIIFEVLATYNRRDALRRAGNNRSNKGFEAAQSALAMIAALNRVKR